MVRSVTRNLDTNSLPIPGMGMHVDRLAFDDPVVPEGDTSFEVAPTCCTASSGLSVTARDCAALLKSPGVLTISDSLEIPFTPPGKATDGTICRQYGQAILQAWVNRTYRAPDPTAD